MSCCVNMYVIVHAKLATDLDSADPIRRYGYFGMPQEKPMTKVSEEYRRFGLRLRGTTRRQTEGVLLGRQILIVQWLPCPAELCRSQVSVLVVVPRSTGQRFSSAILAGGQQIAKIRGSGLKIARADRRAVLPHECFSLSQENPWAR